MTKPNITCIKNFKISVIYVVVCSIFSSTYFYPELNFYHVHRHPLNTFDSYVLQAGILTTNFVNPSMPQSSLKIYNSFDFNVFILTIYKSCFYHHVHTHTRPYIHTYTYPFRVFPHDVP